jgi:hypothetical protein
LCKSCKRLRKNEEKHNLLDYSSGESDDETRGQFALMTEEERAERVADLWRTMLAKSKGAVRILNKLSDLNRHIYLHGSTRKKEDVEMQDKMKPLRFILMPDSDLISYWNVIMMLLLLYTATYVPFKTAFIEESPEYVNNIEFAIDSLFFVDIVVNFISAYENADKNIESTNRKSENKRCWECEQALRASSVSDFVRLFSGRLCLRNWSIYR